MKTCYGLKQFKSPQGSTCLFVLYVGQRAFCVMHCASDSKYVLKALCKCVLHVFPVSYCLTICMSTSTCKRNQTGPDLHVLLVT